MTSMNNFQVDRGSRSARIQPRSTGSAKEEESPFELLELSEEEFELDFHRLKSFNDVRVINNPELSPKSTYTFITRNEAQESASSAFEVPSDEIAILSISSSSTKSSPASGQPGVSIRNIQSSTNSDRIDEWCLSSHFFNELHQNAPQSSDGTNHRFLVSSLKERELYTSAKLKKLTSAQRIAVQQLSRDLYPILRTCYGENSHRPLPACHQERRFDDIPSFFPQRDIIYKYYSIPFEFDRFSDVDIESSQASRLMDDNIQEPSNRSSSTASSSLENRSWFGWTLLSRFLDREW
ncbi:YJL185C [Saccharomyces arboricola H-6]|uniref:YJL185C n=1 Tax=Saccharomyces arboricola (strain H-6 / AS 2.3317 / CBS 10644) TaxID=1160507 RepID=J8Q6J1_SACAR|nr:YJL185C [Saccharomyces arboricola H-6]